MDREIYLSIPYDQKLMELVRQVPGAHWNPKRKQWVTANTSSAREAISKLGLTQRIVKNNETVSIPMDADKAKQAAPFKENNQAFTPAVGGSMNKQRRERPKQRAINSSHDLTNFEEMLMREGRAPQTIKSYKSVIWKLAEWWKKPLIEAKRDDLLSYLTFCIKERQYSRATMNQVVNAIRAFYERMLERPKDESRACLRNPNSPKNWMISDRLSFKMLDLAS